MIRLDSISYSVAPADVEAACTWLATILHAHPVHPEMLAHGVHGLRTEDGLCVEVSTRWDSSPHGDPYFTVDDLDVLAAWCAQRGIETSPIERTPAGGPARLMELVGPAGLRLWVLDYRGGLTPDGAP